MSNLGEQAMEILDELHTERLAYESEYIPLADAANLLAEYERTGMDPEAIERMQDAFGRGLTLRTDARERLEIIKGLSTDRLRELAEADRDGRCVVLPCEVGRTVYIPFCDEIVEKRIGQFHINGYTNPRIWADIDCDWATTQRVRWDLSFGKTLFLTREAAEAVLKGEKHGDIV